MKMLWAGVVVELLQKDTNVEQQCSHNGIKPKEGLKAFFWVEFLVKTSSSERKNYSGRTNLPEGVQRFVFPEPFYSLCVFPVRT